MPVVESLSLIRHSQTQKFGCKYRYWQNLALSWWPSTKSTWQAERLRTFRQNHSQASRSARVFSFKISDFRILWSVLWFVFQRRKREPFSHRPAKCASWKTVWWGDETLLLLSTRFRRVWLSLRALCRKAMEGSEWEQLGPYLVGSNMFAPQGVGASAQLEQKLDLAWGMFLWSQTGTSSLLSRLEWLSLDPWNQWGSKWLNYASS